MTSRRERELKERIDAQRNRPARVGLATDVLKRITGRDTAPEAPPEVARPRVVNHSTTHAPERLTTAEPELVNPPTSPVVNQPTSEAGALSPATIRDRQFASRQNAKVVGFRMPVDRHLVLKAWCVLRGIDVQDFILEAVYEKATGLVVNHATSQPVEWLTNRMEDPHDDSLIEDEILSLYRSLTGNRVRPTDREARREMATVDRRFIEAGMLLTLDRAARKSPPTKVHSFRYCLGAIEEVCEAHVGDIDTYLAYLRANAVR